MKQGMMVKWPLVLLMSLMLALAGCDALTGDDDDDDGKKASATPDTFTVVMDGVETEYEEAEADNDFGYDPYLIAWYDTENDQVHFFVTTDIEGDISGLIVALSFAPADAEGDGATTFNEVSYEENYDVTTDANPVCLDDDDDADDVIITIEESAPEVGDQISGTFGGAGPDWGAIRTASWKR